MYIYIYIYIYIRICIYQAPNVLDRPARRGGANARIDGPEEGQQPATDTYV